jgi:cytoskeletal protein CcmA (bactofilin family)/DNA-directed RNA polymerase subunit RPC12/RpoP
MPASKQGKVWVACPHCGHSQEEPRAVFSTICKKCRRNFRVKEEEVLNYAPKAPKAPETVVERKAITCFECGRELEVPVSAQTSMCKWCGSHIDLQDYRITAAVSRNFKTKGAFTLEATGYVFNSEALVGDAVIKGRFLGKLVAERSLAIHTTAEIKGSFTSGRLIIPAANRFRWKEPIRVGAAEIAGELAADLQAEGTITLKSTARMFGDMQARNLVVEEGAVVVGVARIGRPGN